MRTLEGFCADLVPLGFLTDRWIGEAGEEIAVICIQPVEKTCALSDVLRGVLILCLGFRREPIVELPEIEGERAALALTSDGIAGNGGAEGEELLHEALFLRLYAYQVVLLINRHSMVWIYIDLQTCKEEEDGYLHILHIEGMIAVCLGYLRLHDEGNLLQLGRGALVPAARDGEVYLFLHVLIF